MTDSSAGIQYAIAIVAFVLAIGSIGIGIAGTSTELLRGVIAAWLLAGVAAIALPGTRAGIESQTGSSLSERLVAGLVVIGLLAGLAIGPIEASSIIR